MVIDKIYQSQGKNKGEIIFQLRNGMKIIKRTKEAVHKFDLDKWDEVSYIPDDFQESQRCITDEEGKKLKEFIVQQDNRDKNNRSIWSKIRRKWQYIMNKIKFLKK